MAMGTTTLITAGGTDSGGSSGSKSMAAVLKLCIFSGHAGLGHHGGYGGHGGGYGHGGGHHGGYGGGHGGVSGGYDDH